MERGLIHVYTGDGKGKTTAALGLLARAYGCGLNCVLVQFLKGKATGELAALEKLTGVTVFRYGRDLGFFKFADGDGKREMTGLNNTYLSEAFRLAHDGLCDMLVLDEFCAAYNNGAVDTALADNLIGSKPYGLELILTGRDAPKRFIDAADYVTEMICLKHPYCRGVESRKGIEF